MSSGLNSSIKIGPGLLLGLLAFWIAVTAMAKPAAHTPANVPIRFEGNRVLADSALLAAAQDEITSYFDSGNLGADADDAAFQISLAYRRLGYAWVSVQYRFDTVHGKPGLVFAIAEGPLVRIKRIQIEGNRFASSEALLAFCEGRRAGFLGTGSRLYDPGSIRTCAATLQAYYSNAGFLDVQIPEPQVDFSPDRREVVITMRIYEGVRYITRMVDFSGELLDAAMPRLRKIPAELQDQPYFARQRVILRSRILEIYGDLGYPDARVRVDAQMNTATGSVVLAAHLVSGPQVRIAEVAVSGNTTTQTSFIQNRLALKSGQPYSLSQERASFRSLYGTGLFTRVELNLQKTPDPNRNILAVDVREDLSRELYLEPGYGSYEMLRLLAGYQEKNLWGTGRRFRAEAQVSMKNVSLLGRLTDPWLLNSDVTGDVSLYFNRRQEPAFTSQELGTAVQFSLRPVSPLLLSLSYDYAVDRLLDIRADEDLGSLVTFFRAGTVGGQANFDTRNDVLYPTQGQKYYFSVEAADPRVGSQITYVRFTLGAHQFWPMTASSVLALRYDTGLILPGKDAIPVPLNKRFYNGGANTVRSFLQDALGPVDPSGTPVGGLAYTVATLEWRQRVFAGINLTGFMDWGNVSPGRSRTQEGVEAYTTRDALVAATFKDFWSDFRLGLGVGLEYLLPVGPARLDIGFNPNPDSVLREPGYAVHFSIGMAF